MGSGALSSGQDGGAGGGPEGASSGRSPGAFRVAALRAVAALAAASVIALFTAQAGGCGSSGPQRPDGGPSCQQGDGTCDAGTRCVNRNCVPTCETSACPPGLYCESPQSPIAVCSPIDPYACRNTNDCPVPQTCVQGLCLGAERRADGGTIGCILSETGSDGCSEGAVCFQDRRTGQILNQCIGLPHCSPKGFCPIGFLGSTCNQLPDGGFIFPGKMRVCLFSLCAIDLDCPQGTACFREHQSPILGKCQTGRVGNACYTAADCFNSTYCAFDGGVDDGGNLGQCVQ